MSMNSAMGIFFFNKNNNNVKFSTIHNFGETLSIKGLTETHQLYR